MNRYAGSSPRVRGTLIQRRNQVAVVRFIPACAGNSLDRVVQAEPSRGSSPRVRGTRSAVAPDSMPSRFIPACAGNSKKHNARPNAGDGSSPRVRGTPVAGRAAGMPGRFIPACAGNSSAPSGPARPPSVHPRVCGELRTRRHAHGSPGRFIPACAGNSHRRGPPPPPTSVHPRVCGELGPRLLLTPSLSGSSPRVRGTRAQHGLRSPRVRFIPACAGNSRNARAAIAPAPVHPRVCGELPRKSKSFKVAYGSSPRVRGTRRPSRDRGGGRRFIPACAGNSSLRVRRSLRRPVHPRVCGELDSTKQHQHRSARFIPACAGNSQKARQRSRGWHRFIPACAGNSARRDRRGGRIPVHPRVCGELDWDA